MPDMIKSDRTTMSLSRQIDDSLWDAQVRVFETGATRDQDENKLEYKGFISWKVMKKFAEYMHQHRFQTDGKLRDADNWKKGIPLESYESSLIRHVFEFAQALESQDRDVMDKIAPAIMFNIQGWMHERP